MPTNGSWQLRSSRAHCDQELARKRGGEEARRRGGEEEDEGGGGGGAEGYLKIYNNNPHLAGGECKSTNGEIVRFEEFARTPAHFFLFANKGVLNLEIHQVRRETA